MEYYWCLLTEFKVVIVIAIEIIEVAVTTAIAATDLIIIIISRNFNYSLNKATFLVNFIGPMGHN